MKNFLFHYCFIVSLFASTGVIGQDEVQFKIEYRPGRIYHSISTITQHVDIKFVGPPSYVDSLKKAGGSDTRSVLQEFYSDMDFRTMKNVNDSGQFGIDIVYNKLRVGKDSLYIPAGTTLKGIVTTKSLPKIISVESEQLDEATKQALISMVSNIFSQVDLPEKTMKKGERFTHMLPLKMPVGNLSLKMNIETTYTLVHIENGIATFLIEQHYLKDPAADKNSIIATGEGNGELVYDMTESFYKKYRISTEIKMHINSSKAEVTEDMKGYSEINYTIKKSD